MQHGHARTFVYRIDAQDKISFVSPAWLGFARENGATPLTTGPLIGESLWDFVSGDETRHLYELLFHKVRQVQETISVPFRCDSPTVRRWMELTLHPFPQQGIELAGKLLRQESRNGVTILDPVAQRTTTFMSICSWCKRIVVSEEWMEIEEAVVRTQLFNATPLPQLTHGVCPTCEQTILQELQECNF